MKKIFIFLLFTTFVFGQVKKITYTGVQVKIIVTGSIRGKDTGPSTEDPIPLLIFYIGNKQDGSSAEAVTVYGTNSFKTTPDTITFTSNFGTNYILACALNNGVWKSTDIVPGSAFFLDINGVKDTITLAYTLNLEGIIGPISITGISNSGKVNNPTDFFVKQNYPNPFNPSTKIDFELPSKANVQINIYNEVGQLVKSFEPEEKAVGSYSLVWDGKNNLGQTVSSGSYFYQVKAGENIQTKKMLLLK